MIFNILYEDDDILVVNKPPGLPVIAEGWNPDAPYLIKLLSKSHGKLWVVHRLDKFTSGVVICAKNAYAHRFLNDQFEKRQVRKKYHAILEGVPSWESIVTNQSLRVNSGRSHRTIIDNSNGKESSTEFHLITSIDCYSLVEASPKTGRTHQIRAHAANLGFPILGDLLYGGHKNKYINRLALHSHLISFSHPSTKLFMEITAPYPLDFAYFQFILGFDTRLSK